MLIKYIKETFHIGKSEKKRSIVISQTNQAIDRLNVFLSYLNKLRWATVRLEEDFPQRKELLASIEDIRFFAEDALRRIARCKACYEMRNYDEGDRLFIPAQGQMYLAEQRYKDFMNMLKTIESSAKKANISSPVNQQQIIQHSAILKTT